MPEFTWHGLRLDPLDVLFFRGGRPFDAAARVEGDLPNPQTLAGALRTALLAQHGPDDLFRKLGGSDDILVKLRRAHAPEWILQARFRGPWLALDHGGSIEPLVPVPAVLLTDPENKTVHRNRPLEKVELPGWPKGGALPLWRKDGRDAKQATGYLTEAGLRAFLNDDIPAWDDIIPASDLFGYDNRTGIAIAPDELTTKEGDLYGIKLLVLKPDLKRGDKKVRICLYTEIGTTGDNLPGDLVHGAFPFGGEGRYVTAKSIDRYAWPTVQVTGDRCAWLMLSPGMFPAASPCTPDALDISKIQAAASASPLAVSGWNVHSNSPRPTRFVVPAGAVYFVQGTTDLANHSLCADAERMAEGWGFALQGVWKDAQ